MPVALLTMLKGSVGTIAKNWKEILIGILLMAVLYQNTSSVRYLFFIETIPSLQARLEQAQDNLDTCVKGNEVLATIIEDRNKEVTKWKDVSTKLEGENKELGIKLQNMRNVTNTKVRKILKSKTPKSCEASIQYLRDSREELKWPK